MSDNLVFCAAIACGVAQGRGASLAVALHTAFVNCIQQSCVAGVWWSANQREFTELESVYAIAQVHPPVRIMVRVDTPFAMSLAA